jgi:serine/threonine-protein kinase
VTTLDLRDQLQAALGASYVLERELGRGGMATVFLAQDAKHGRPVALKVLHQDLAASLGPERFRREITLAAKLQHPHILTVLDSGETPAGLLWFTMPYVEGESLRDRLNREHQLPVPEALRLAREAALALDYAHRHGVIHRDVKPENILLIDGQAMVADFGIARALAPGSTQTLTETGVALGTPAYMSPEQASGERTLDARTDIYSLGAVLYEMLAGEAPFTGPTAQAVIARRFTERPRALRTVRETVAEPVERAVDTALAKAPADRFATAADFAKALDTAERTMSAPAATQAARPLPTHRRFPVTAAALSLGFLVGVGVLFAWRHHAAGSGESGASGPVRLAVLPFDNLGDSSQAYFADGLTDAVRGKLTGVPGLAVIAPASSGQYRHTTKTPAEIGQELGGVRYLLVGKVRWAKGSGATSRVQVSPALVDVTTGTDTWEQPFDAPLTDVFQVQADIAGKVAEQLRVRLGTEERQVLAQRPTADLDAYDAYLRGQAIANSGSSPIIQRRAAQAFGEAVHRDSTFALAWAGLTSAYAFMYSNGTPTPAGADSTRLAAERALALAPDLPEAHAAVGLYYQVVRSDYVRAFAEDSAGLAHAPNNVLLLERAGAVDERLGQWEAAVKHYEQATRLDPQSATGSDRLALATLRLRRYTAAQSAADRALALQPDNISIRQTRAMVSLAQGDLAGARAVLHAAPASVDPSALAAYVAEYWDLGWVLDSTQERTLLGLTAATFDDSRADWGTVLAEQYALRGDRTRSRAYADSARVAYERVLKATPANAGLHVEYGLVLAYLGRKPEAIENGQRGVALLPIAQDARDGPYIQHQLVRIYLLVGENEKALDLLEPLLRAPYYLSPAWLRIDPGFAPLHGNPRFKKLIAGS